MVFVSVLWLSPLAPTQMPLLPRADLKGLERVVGELTKAGHQAETQVVLGVLEQLGLPTKDAAALRGTADKDFARRKRSPEPGERASKSVAAEAARLAERLPGLQDDARRRVATLLLQLDGELAAAHLVLGREAGPGGFGPAGEGARAERRASRHRALHESRRLQLGVRGTEVTGESASGFGVGLSGGLIAALQQPMTRVQVGNLTLLSSRSVTQTVRIVEQALRALAIVNFALTGKIECPSHPPVRIVMMDTRVMHSRALEVALARGWITEKKAEESRQLAGFYVEDGGLVDACTLESEASAVLLVEMAHGLVTEPAICAGLLNWVCRATLGTSIPSYAWIEAMETRRTARTASQDPRVQAMRTEMLRLADAGLAGGRSYLRFLASQKEDPPWSDAMLDDVGKIQGEALLKATFVVEYLMDDGQLGTLVSKVSSATAASAPERFAAALGTPLPEFEATFREWIVGLQPGVAQRLGGSGDDVPREARSTLVVLDKLRAVAFDAASASVSKVEPLTWDRETSRGCALHASYLAAYPEAAARWPDAHEENPDHVEWSVDGAWAGAHAVIAPGVKDGEQAVLGWMGTFFHRLPLLDPGLVRIGYGFAGGVAVLDSGSFVRVVNEPWYVAWPPNGASDVPTKFVPEMPNPVPGEDQDRFGYPVTLQAGPRADRLEPIVEMRLLEGGKSGREVPCWFSSPQKPLNPELAPANSFCLIPKVALRSGTNYTVVARMIRDSQEITWSWKTK